MTHSNLKSKLNEALLHRINTQIETINNAIASIHESKGNETKSSAGDKFETGRAMLHLEQDKLEGQLSNAYQLKSKLETLKLDHTSDRIGQGSLVFTNMGIYFISIGIGKMQFEDTTYFVISNDSPIGKLFIGKMKGDIVSFNNKKIELIDFA